MIDVKNMAGTITGSNARAVLIACYRFLREIGFAFVKPGKYGDFPDIDGAVRHYKNDNKFKGSDYH